MLEGMVRRVATQVDLLVGERDGLLSVLGEAGERDPMIARLVAGVRRGGRVRARLVGFALARARAVSPARIRGPKRRAAAGFRIS